jgi:hypothetical protein
MATALPSFTTLTGPRATNFKCARLIYYNGDLVAVVADVHITTDDLATV